MNTSLFILAGALLITLALILYSRALIPVLKSRMLTKKQLIILSSGFVSEVIAVWCMAAISTQSAFTPHSLLGYAGAFVIFVSIIWGWKTAKDEEPWALSKCQFNFYRFVYIFWVIS